MKRKIRLTENEMVEMIERIINEVKREKRNQILESKKNTFKKVLNEQNITTLGGTSFKTLKFGNKEWNIKSKDVKGIKGFITGTINTETLNVRGEQVVRPVFSFQSGPKKIVYRGELQKTSDSATDIDGVGNWVWRVGFKKVNTGVDSSETFFTDGSREIGVDKFMSMLSSNKNANTFVTDILNPLQGIN